MNHSKWRLISILYIILIFCLSSIPDTGKQIIRGENVISNLAHIPIYTILTYLLFKAFQNKSSSSTRIWIISILCAFIFGIIQEFYQALIPGRTTSLSDVCLNGIGIGLALIIKWKKKE